MSKTGKRPYWIKAAGLILTLVLACMLTACGDDKLEGEYKSQGSIAQTFTFDGDEIMMSAFGLNATGTYKIEGDKIIITYTLFGMEQTWSQPFSRTDDGFIISGEEFKKVK